jgi:hypothetical protein
LDKLFDPIRNCYIDAYPEEKVRQNLIKKMLALGYKKNLIAVEKELSSLPHLKNLPLPGKRRADILYFAKGIHESYDLYPLLMIECKAIPLKDSALAQVIGYNQYVQACFVSVANLEEIYTLWYDPKKKVYEQIDFLPTYDQLYEAAKTAFVVAKQKL